jgi:hypothetical protein
MTAASLLLYPPSSWPPPALPLPAPLPHERLGRPCSSSPCGAGEGMGDGQEEGSSRSPTLKSIHPFSHGALLPSLPSAMAPCCPLPLHSQPERSVRELGVRPEARAALGQAAAGRRGGKRRRRGGWQRWGRRAAARGADGRRRGGRRAAARGAGGRSSGQARGGERRWARVFTGPFIRGSKWASGLAQ